jgi:hypothetical protein
MVQTDQTNPIAPGEDTDLAKQYQDILDHYSKELASKPASAEPKASPDNVIADEAKQSEIPLEPEPESVPLTELPPPPPPVSPEPAPVIPKPEPAPLDLPPSPVFDSQVSAPKPNNFFKYLFFIALLIFLGVCGAIVYTIFYSNPNVPQSSPSTNTVNSTATPTVSTNVCQLNDKTYSVGESFAAADGCNTCSCSADLTISCTTKACEITPTKTATTSANVKVTPTKIATKSATKSATVSATPTE